jgi:hypothetical protein
MAVQRVSVRLWVAVLCGFVVGWFDHEPSVRERYELARSLA